MNNDVLLEILLRLHVQSLFRVRAVCKLWCYIIDSPHFIKLHTLRRNDNKDEKVYLRFTFEIDDSHTLVRKKVSINLLDNGRPSLKSHDFLPPPTDLRVSGAVKGLVCLSSPLGTLDIAICNPFLGQFKILPLYAYFFSHYHNTHGRLLCCDYFVGLGFDEDYKVVQLLQCSKHCSLHANMYSARTNSWSELDIDRDLFIVQTIKSLSKNGSFAHWKGFTRERDKEIILSFDMKNEVFRTIPISLMGDEVLDNSFKESAILAKGDYSFVILVVDRWKLKVYESSGDGSELIWNNVNNVNLYSFWWLDIERSDDIPIWGNDDCVVLRGHREGEVILYDYRARKFIRRFKMGCISVSDEDIIEYVGSLISLLKQF
ncbi:putative F-box protein At3g51171 [Salvia hispanica]|uniref:putative F-box protein At3g51171 n=1 Tax=Salvia hispanica TaxID=49212 RepID=UPI0020093028|nr:putative F-box protein At3g51171 [Salvia hispanica]